MAFFETCSDDGKRSLNVTEKFTCPVCGKIKPIYNVHDSKLRSNEDKSDQYTKEEKERKFVCQCDEETCFQWFKRIVGLGPERDGEKPRERFLSGWHPVENLRNKLGAKPKERGSKTSLNAVKESEIDEESVRPDVSTVPEESLSIDAVDLGIPNIRQIEADTEDQSQTSRESKLKKKKKKKRRIKAIPRTESGSDSAFHRAQLKKIAKEKFGIPASTATVFHTYRSRASYSFRPEERKKLRKPKCAVDSKYTEQSAIVGTLIKDISAENENDLGLNWSAYHSDCEREILTSKFKRLPNLHLSRSGPQTKRDYREMSDWFSMTSSLCSRTAVGKLSLLVPPRRKRFTSYNTCYLRSSSEPYRSKSFSAKSRKRSLLVSTCSPVPYPIVLSCVSPSLRKSSHGRKKCCPAPRIGLQQRPLSCPGVFFASKPRGQDITSSILHSKLRVTKILPDYGSSARVSLVNYTGPCCPPPPKREMKSARNRRFVPLCGTSPPTSECCRKRKGGNPRAVFCPNPCALNEKRISKKQDNAKVHEIIQRCNLKKRPPRSCPPICIGTSLSPFSDSYRRSFNKVQKNASAVSRFLPLSSTGVRPIFGLNYTQSSNPGKSPGGAICTKCKNPIEFKKVASDRSHKCEFVLAPTCIKRKGPRSTVREYLSTIEHPKPRPRATRLSAQGLLGKDASGTAAGQPDEKTKESVASGKSSDKKKKKKAPADKIAASDPSKPGREETTSATEEGDPKVTNEAAESTSKQPPTAIQAGDGGRDGNNNYGLDVSASAAPSRPTSTRPSDHSWYTTTRVSSVPAQSYTSYMDSGYARMNSSPYFTSGGMRTSYGSASYSPSGDFGYLRASQEFRKNIRSYYEQKRLFSERTSNNTDLTVWRSKSQDVPDSQFHSWSQTADMKVQMRSPEKPKRRKVETGQTNNLGYKKKPRARLEVKAVSLKQGDTKETSLSSSPRLKNSLPSYFPRKSFVEGEVPITIVNQEKRETKESLNKNASKSQLVENHKTKAENVGGASLGKVEEQPHVVKSVVEETQVEAILTKDSHESDTQDDATKNDDDEGLKKEQESLDLNDEENPARHIEGQIRGIIDGKESSVDSESYTSATKRKPLPSTVRKVEPSGNFLKTLLPETSPVSTDTHSITASVVTEAADPSINNMSTIPGLMSTRAQLEEGQNLRPPRAQDTSPIPVFQNLMDRFSQKVQIFVRTKEKDEEVADKDSLVKREAEGVEENGVVIRQEDSKSSPGDRTNGISDCAQESATIDKESIAAWSPDNKSKNRVAPSCEATSNCVSWSDLAYATQAGVMQQPSSACSIITQTASAVSSSVTVAAALSMASLRGAAGDPATCGSSKAKNYELEYESCTNKEHTGMEQSLAQDRSPALLKPKTNFVMSVKEAVLGSNKTLNDVMTHGELDTNVDLGTRRGSGIYVINPTFKACLGPGELGQSEKLAHTLAALSRPRKSRSVAASMAAHKKGLCNDSVGSSVDPIPHSENVTEKQSFLDAIRSNHSMFQKVGGDGCDGKMIMTAKSRFLKTVGAHSMTNICLGKSFKGADFSQTEAGELTANFCMGSPAVQDGGPFGAMLCRSLDNTLTSAPEQKNLVRVGSLTEAMKKFISLHGTPV